MAKTVSRGLVALKKAVPKLTKNQRVKIFGVTRPQHFNPSTWTINTPGSSPRNLGHSHYAYLNKPEFEIKKSGMWFTRGYKKPKSKNVADLEKTTRPPSKTPYAYVTGEQRKVGELRSLPKDVTKKKKVPGKNAIYKKGGFKKEKDINKLISGESTDAFMGQKMKSGSQKRLVGRKEFDTLSRKEKRKVHLVSGVRMTPNGGLSYYSRNLYYLSDF